MVGCAHRRRGVRASAPTPLVVPDQTVVIDERWCRHERQKCRSHDGTDQQYRFTRSFQLVLQLDPVDLCAFHGSPPKLVLATVRPSRDTVASSSSWEWPPTSYRWREQDCYRGNSCCYTFPGQRLPLARARFPER